MTFKISVDENGSIVDLFKVGISPDSIIPVDAITITDEQGEQLRNQHWLYRYINDNLEAISE